MILFFMFVFRVRGSVNKGEVVGGCSSGLL